MDLKLQYKCDTGKDANIMNDNLVDAFVGTKGHEEELIRFVIAHMDRLPSMEYIQWLEDKAKE